ncbi:MAG: hypothetical protein FWE29_06760 [Defluviitaleaceae bacterium]|nr:hypothetical protein [Defluviitaleaceae bacterium]
MGYLAEFITLFALILLHEAAHVFFAKLCGAKVSELTILPIGVSAAIRSFDFLSTPKKIFILISGPLLNLTLAGAAFIFFRINTSFFVNANLAIFALNILPILPLDGGNLFMAAFNNKLGILPTADILAKLGRFFSIIIITFGIIQVILYPYNISLIILGSYLLRNNKNKSISYQNAFIKILEFPKQKNKTGFMPVKHIVLPENFSTFEALKLFGFNCYTVIYIVSNGDIMKKITEDEVIKLAFDG